MCAGRSFIFQLYCVKTDSVSDTVTFSLIESNDFPVQMVWSTA